MNYTPTTPKLFKTKRKLINKLPKTYPPHGSTNNQKEQNHKETKSHGSPCDFTINHKETSHGSPCDFTINHKETTSHGSPCDFAINHKETTSHDSPCDFTINHKESTSHGSLCDSIINHKETTSHGAHDISLCTMIKLENLTPH